MTSATTPNDEAVEREIDALMRTYERMVEAKDASGLAALYAQDARFLAADAPAAEGREAIRRAIQGFFDAGYQSMRLGTVQLDAIEDVVIKQGTFEAVLATEGGPVTVVGKDIEILRRRDDGEWEFVVDIFNLDVPLDRLLHRTSTARRH